MFDAGDFNFDGSGNLVFGDNKKALFGAGSDGEIYSDGTNFLMKGSGTTYLRGSSVNIGSNGGSGGFYSNIYVHGPTATSRVEMTYGGSKKFETTSTGVTITGTTEASVFKVGSGQYFDESSGNVRINNVNNADILFLSLIHI